MKKLVFLVIFGICGLAAFAQSETIPFKITSYQISRRQLANQYSRAEVIVDYEAMTWEIILYRKDGGNPERIKLEKFDDIGRNNVVFRAVTIVEAAGTSGSNLFAYLPKNDDNVQRVDLCDNRTEGVKRRLVMEF
ncbi:MAG: hypothetical protein FWG27_00030 [Treponema sp.]|jgi:hypothetical protein|nr:hypothetical protein [Treponema sp.]